MSSPIAHTAVAYAIYSIYRPKLPAKPVIGIPAKIAWPLAAVFFSLIPDLDAIVAWTYGNMSQFHNNLSHSLLFCIAVSIIASPLFSLFTGITMRQGFLFSLTCGLSHILIDLLSLGRGVMLFWPFSTTRFHAPITLFIGVPWSSSLTSHLYLLMLLNDTCFAVAVIAITIALRNRKERE